MYGIAIFAVAYPLISGAVLVRDWDSGVGEIYPIAPWALFCFVPNQESEFAIRFRAIDGKSFDEPLYYEELADFDQHQKTLGRGIIHDMGALWDDGPPLQFAQQRRLFERNFVAPIAREARYELVRRDYDVLNRWRTGAVNHTEILASLVYPDRGTRP
jgi:hypothetical protein